MNKLTMSLGLLLGVFAQMDLSALNLSLSRTDMERALALGRRLSSDRDRARFHDQYVIRVDGAKVDYSTVERRRDNYLSVLSKN